MIDDEGEESIAPTESAPTNNMAEAMKALHGEKPMAAKSLPRTEVKDLLGVEEHQAFGLAQAMGMICASPTCW